VQSSSRLHVSSLLQLLLSGAGLAVSAAAVLGSVGLAFYLSRENTDVVRIQAGALVALAWISAVFGLAALPSLYHAGRRLLDPDRPQPAAPGRFRMASFALLVWPLLLAAGYALQKADGPVWLFVPLHALATILPLWWLVEFCARGLAGSTPQRRWGALNFGLFVSNPLALVLELVGGLGALFAVGVFLASQPELLQQLEDFRSQIFAFQNDPAAMNEFLAPFFSDPRILLLILLGAAGLVPLLEELTKPLAVWAMGGRKITPSEGFVLGAVAGAAFALQETLLVAANADASTWLTIMIGRTGTGVLHISTTALMGRAIAQVWDGGGGLRLAGSYLLVVAMHAFWNTFSVLSGFGGFFSGSGLFSQTVRVLGQVSPVMLALLAGGFLLLLWDTNRRLSRAGVVESGGNSTAPALLEPEDKNQEGSTDGIHSELI
jgi:hypothetical protein